MSKHTLFLITTLFFAIALFLTLQYTPLKNFSFLSSNANQNIPSPTILQNDIPTENYLSLSPNILQLAPSTSASVSIMLESRGIMPTIIQLELAFDPTILTNIDIVPGTFFKTPQVPLKKIDYNNGRISYALEAAATNELPDGPKNVATLSFTTIGRQKETTIYFLPKTVVKTHRYGDSLKAAYGAKILLR